MRWDADRSCYVLASGREISANRGILGLGPKEGAPASEGYDGDVEYEYEYGRGFVVSGWVDANGEPVGFTPEERREIAGEMIRRWAAWGGEGRDGMTPDEQTAERVLAGVMAGCFGDPPHDVTAFRWRVVETIAAAFQAEREACAQVAESSGMTIIPGVQITMRSIAAAIRARGEACSLCAAGWPRDGRRHVDPRPGGIIVPGDCAAR